MNQLPIPDILDAKSTYNLTQFLAKNGLGVNGRSHSSALTSIPSGAYTKLTPTNDWANGITWDATNHRFTINTEGYYQVNGTVTFSNPSAAVEVVAAIYKNGSSVAECQGTTNATSEGGASVSDIMKCAKGDYIELYCYQNKGSNLAIFTSSNLTYLSIHKV